MLTNPYLDSNWETELTILNPDIRYQSKLRLFKFLSKEYGNKMFSQIAISRLRLFYFTSRHAFLSTFVAGVIFYITLLGVEASAPDNLKPSKLITEAASSILKTFQTNKIPDKDPYTGLNPDDQNNVKNIDNCDLAIKYPKMLRDSLLMESGASNGKYYFSSYIASSTGSPLMKYEDNLSINCSSTLAEANSLNSIEIDNQRLLSETGWMITQAPDLKNIRMTVSTAQGVTTKSISFSHNNLNYIVSVYENSVSEYDIKFNDFQLQFNSLVQNRFSPDEEQLIIEQNKVCPNINISYKPSLYRFNYNSEDSEEQKSFHTTIQNFSGEDSVSALDIKPEYASFALQCFSEPAEKGDLAGLGYKNVSISKIPFISSDIAKMIKPRSLWKHDYEVVSKPTDYEPVITGKFSEYQFEDLNGIMYQIQVMHPDIVEKDFNINIRLSNQE